MPTKDHQPDNRNQEIALPKLTFGDLSKEILKDQYDADSDSEFDTDTIERPHARWETDDLAYTYYLFEMSSNDGQMYYQVERHGLSTTESELISYWPNDNNITYRPFKNGPATIESPDGPFGHEFIEHIEQGYARTKHAQARREEEKRQEARYYNQEFTKLTGHLALGIAMNQPEAQEIITSARADNSESHATISHELFELAQSKGFDLNFNLFQAAFDNELAPSLFQPSQPVELVEPWIQPVVAKVNRRRHPWKTKVSDLLFAVDIVAAKFRSHRGK